MRRTYRTLYRLHVMPWDQSVIPAPLAGLVEGPSALPPGQALDLGCGTGQQARYLAEHGWSVTAVDYIPDAITTARDKDPSGHVVWRVADAADPHEVDPDGRLAGAISLVLDNGCLHGIPARSRPGWARTVNTLAAPGATLLIRAAPRGHRGIGPRGINADEVAALLIDRWQPTREPEPNWYRYTLAPSKTA